MAETTKSTLVKAKADQVTAALNETGVGFDPTVIIAIIQQIIAMLGGCKLKAAEALSRCRNPGLLDRLRLRRVMRQQSVPESQQEEVQAALQDMAATTTEEEMASMLS